MPKRIINQTAFTGGELSPRLYSRSETAEFGSALQTGTNAYIMPHGPIARRNGTQFIAEVKDSSAAVRLVRYQLSQDTAFILEFGNEYIRFFKSTGQVLESNLTITNITQADPAVVTSASHGLANNDHVYITGVAGMTEVNSSTVPYKVANVTTNTFELQTIAGTDVDSSAFTAYSSGGVVNRIYEITSPYTTAQLDNIQYVQSGSTMYLVHPDVSPRQLVRTSDTSWTLSEIEFLPPPTYESGFEPSATCTPAATTGVGVNFTASSGVFLDGDVGRQIINLSSGETGRASITSITSATVAVCDIIEDFTDTNAIASGDWKMDLSPVVDLEFDNTQAGAIVNIRSEHQNGSLGSRLTITNVTSANPAVVTSASHGLANGEKVQIQDVVGMTQINNKEFTVDNVTTNTFELKGENSSGYTTYSSGGIARKILTDINKDAFRAADVGKYILANGGVMQIVTVNGADDIDAEILKSMNSGDSTGNWTLEEDTWDATRGYPKAVGLFEQRLIFGGTSTQPQTIWMSETGIFDGFGTGADDEDSIEVELVSNEVNEINWISAGRDLVVGTSGGEITVSSGNTGAISPSNIQQIPRTYHGSRVQQVENIRDEILFVQGSERKIRTFRYDFNIDGYTGDDLTFLAEHITEGGITEIAYAQEPNTNIYAVTDNGDLLAATYDRGKKVIGWTKFTTDGNFERVQRITSGENDQPWVVVKRTINSATKRYIELLSSGDGVTDTDFYSDSALSLSTPLTITGITAANPAVVTSTAHGLSNDDKVIIKGLVDPAEADLDADKTNMSSLNGCTFTVANKTANTFELSGKDTSGFNAYGSGGNAYLKVSTLSGLDHLEGKTVQIKIDGAAHANKTVSSGSVTLDTTAGEATVGLPYTTTIKTLPHEFDVGLGSMQGQRVRWARPLLRVYRSHRPLVNGEFLPARNAGDSMDKEVPLFSGYLEYGPLNWSNSAALTITATDPLPLVLTGISGVIDTGVK